MLERLDYVKIAPRRVLDAASGPPRPGLGKRYPAADVVALDFSLGMLCAAKRKWFGRNPLRLCGDVGRLPLGGESFGLVWCNMALHWLADPLPALREFARVLAPDGLLTFSTLGPDTLKELRGAAGARRVHDFTDMHDIGDMLLEAGFAAPVMHIEMMSAAFEWRGVVSAVWRGRGQTRARADRTRGLQGRAFADKLRAGLTGRATFEVVYGHAWMNRKANQEVKTVRVFKRMP
jgi:malonyl-CoA O-methyltransferase